MGLLLGRERLFSVEKSDVEHHKREHMSKHKAYVWSTTDKFDQFMEQVDGATSPHKGVCKPVSSVITMDIL